MPPPTLDIIPPESASTLHGLFLERVRRSPDGVAYRYYDHAARSWKSLTWREMADHVARWQRALEGEGLLPGDRVAICLRNRPEWVMLDQAALGLGLAVVPLFANDRPDNIAYVLRDSGSKLLLVEGEAVWGPLSTSGEDLGPLTRVVALEGVRKPDSYPRLRGLSEWLPMEGGKPKALHAEEESLATIVYTSGTTGHPKGVKLSHRNLLFNAHAGLQSVSIFREDLFLSFLPLSHTLERTVGYYLPIMAGASVAYARSVSQLAEDFSLMRPTVLISVPRIFERTYSRIRSQLEAKSSLERALFKWAVALGWDHFQYRQGRRRWRPGFLLRPALDRLVAGKVRQRMGGRLRLAISGGAALPPEVGKTMIGLGVNLLQGYGLTETSPVVSVNRLENNDPLSVGLPLNGVEVKIGNGDELLTRGPGVMQGYWNHAEATAGMVDSEGWLHTGDKARLREGRVYISGRIKEIIVLATGEKVPPHDLEAAISMDPLFEQVMVVGEGKAYLAALVVLNAEKRDAAAKELGLDPRQPDLLSRRELLDYVLDHLSRQLHAFPGYAKVRRLALLSDPWTVENGFLTPTLKLRRSRILVHHREEYARLYEGH